MAELKVFVDLDDVLVDFYGQCASELFDLDPGRVKEIVKESGKWAITEALGFSEEKLWYLISKCGADFWEKMPLLPWASEMMKELYREFGREHIYVLTSHGHFDIKLTTVGKMIWLQSNPLNIIHKNFIVTSEKHLFAGPGRLLFDDKAENCDLFAEYGGRAAHFPSPGNRVIADLCLHKQPDHGVDCVLRFVTREIEEWKNALEV